MRAIAWHGKRDMRVDSVPDPMIMEPTDVIIQITSTAICGSDLHLYNAFMPTLKEGDIVGHEPMGIVVETGSAVKKLKKGDRVVVPFTISCGTCFFCEKQLYSLCDISNPNHEIAAAMQQWNRQMSLLASTLAEGGPFLLGEAFTLADIPVGLVVNRWVMIEFDKPRLPAIDAYYDALARRPPYRAHGRNGEP